MGEVTRQASVHKLVLSVRSALKNGAKELFLYAEGLRRVPSRVLQMPKLEQLHLGTCAAALQTLTLYQATMSCTSCPMVSRTLSTCTSLG